MSILPQGINWTFEVATLDIPVPDDLMNEKDINEWTGYLESQPVDRLLEKFAASLDQLLETAALTTDLLALCDKQQEYFYTKWTSAIAAGVCLRKRLGHPVSFEDQKKYKTELGLSTSTIIDGLRRLGSGKLAEWEARAIAVEEFENAKDGNLEWLLVEMNQRLQGDRRRAPRLLRA
ncbi:MAG: hypothetical protein ACXW4B_11265 [Micavibrio sp.]